MMNLQLRESYLEYEVIKTLYFFGYELKKELIAFLNA